MTVAAGPTRHLPGRHMMVVGLLLGLLGLALLVALVVALADRGGDGRTSSGTQVQGSGGAAMQLRTTPAFARVELAGATAVTVQVGPSRSVRVTADSNLLRHVTTRVRGGTLAVGTTGSFTTRTPMHVDVTVPSLDAVTLTGSGTLVVTGVHARLLAVSLPGTGSVRVAGSAEELRATLSGSGDLQVQDLVARDAATELSGVGEIRVHVTRDLHATVSGTGSIRYSGDPTSVVSRVTGTGSVSAQP